jgi:tetratricopeptide (TPR) repeat protein
VTQLKLRQGSYETALAAFDDGAFSVCAEILNTALAPESKILRARALIRAGDVNAALAAIDDYPHDGIRHETAAEMLALKIFILSALRRTQEADDLCVEANARCFSSGFVAIEAEIAFGRIIGALSSGDYAKTEQAVEALLSLEDEQPTWLTPRTYRYSLNYWRARALDVRGTVAFAHGEHRLQAEYLRLALQEFDLAEVQDDYIEAGLLANYVGAAVDGECLSIIQSVIERTEQIVWSSGNVKSEFRIFSSIAEALSMSGDQLGALRYFRRCLDCAPTTALRIRANVERARLLSGIGETYSSREELDHAVRLSKTVNWESADANDQRQLVFLAAQVASYSGAEAQRLLERYDALVSSAINVVIVKDERFRGNEYHARALVARANGQIDRATLLLVDAFEVFTAAGYESRAASVAAELAELTNEPHYLAIAFKQAEKSPDSLLARKIARYEAPSESTSKSVVRNLFPVL